VSGNKRPLSVLVVVHTADGEILLLERARHAGYWQSVTGSLEDGEAHRAAAARELAEETGLCANPETLADTGIENRFEIFALWRDRYPEGVTHNVERVFCFDAGKATPIRLAPEEHRACIWLPWQQAADRVFSWTNADAILRLALSRRWAKAPR
jgi:dATP pyrophosphohydrolase